MITHLYFVMCNQGVGDYSFVYSLDKRVCSNTGAPKTAFLDALVHCTNTGAPYSASLGILDHFTKTGALTSA